MSTIRRSVMSIVLVVELAACAGRDPQMISTSQPGDVNLTCPMISAEMQANTQRIGQLQSESSSTTGKNVALGIVGGLLFWPALFAMDLKDGAGKDAATLQVRQTYLQQIGAQKGCEGVQAPVAGWQDAKPAVRS